MRFKLDENLGRRAAALLASAGHDVSTVLEERLSGALETTGLVAPESIDDRVRDFLAALENNELGRELWIVEPGRIPVHEARS